MSACVMDSFPEAVEESFSCRFPLKPYMKDKDVRMQTFGNDWPRFISPCEMSDAGFFYLGNSDRVACFYCGGGLRGWKPSDNAWFEHAKWYPLCEYVLQRQGVEYVRKICAKFGKLDRPQITNPSQSNAVNSIRDILKQHVGIKVTDPKHEERKKLKNEVEILMFLDPHVAYAKKIGIDEDEIERAVTVQLEKNRCKFSSCQDLLNAIFDQTKVPSLAERAKQLEDDEKCTKCEKEKKNALCMPCAHMVVCWQCVQDLTLCWRCHEQVKEKIRVYK